MRRACSARVLPTVLALLTLAGLVLPGALLAGQRPATASTASTASTVSTAKTAGTDQATGSPVSVSITKMTPQWATPKATITVTGVVTDQSKDPVTALSVQLQASDQAFSSAQVLQTYLGDPFEAFGSQSASR